MHHLLNTKIIRLSIILFVLLNTMMLTTACKLTEEDKQNISDAFNPDPVPDPDDDFNDTRLCQVDRFVQPEAEIVRKIDILFVVDTSGSLNEERAGIADGIDAFVGELPAEVDYQVGVMYAHARDKNGSGELVGSPKVLSSQTMSIESIRSELKSRMVNPKTEWVTDGGEVGLYAFTKSLESKLAANKAVGFYRDDAALAVVFVADENDICSWSFPPEGVTLVPDPNKKELPANSKYCGSITPESVVKAVQNVKGDKPFLISGIVYNGMGPVPARGENEIGYGYLETIELANGISIDLASADYDIGMRQIGYLAYKKLNLLTEFNLSRSDFKPISMEVIVDRVSVPFTYVDSLNQVQIDEQDAGDEKSEVLVRYCPPLNPPPTIFNDTIYAISLYRASLEFETDQPVVDLITVRNMDTGSEQVFEDKVEAKYHGLVMTGLDAGTNYEVDILVTNPEGSQTSKTLSFTTTSEDVLL